MTRLFCIPYAGGAATVFKGWQERLPTIEVLPVDLPGRGSRIRERAARRMRGLVDDVVSLVLARVASSSRPYALFGHSMGALVAFEVVRELRRRGAPPPTLLAVSASDAPHVLTPPVEPTHALGEADFLAVLRSYDGTPRAVLENHELLSLVLPALRADFEVCQTYVYEAEPPLDCGLVALAGRDDRLTSLDAMQRWADLTRGRFELRVFPTSHFFIHTCLPEVLDFCRCHLEGPA